MQNFIYYRPVIPLLLSFMTGIMAGNQWPGHRAVASAIIAISMGFAAFRLMRNRDTFISPLILFLSLGYLSLQFWTDPGFSPHHVVHFTDGNPYEISGTVAERPLVKNNRIQLYLKVKTISRNPSDGMIRVTLIGDDTVPGKGDDLKFTSRIRPIRNFSNPGGFDYKRFMTFKRIWGSAYATIHNTVITTTGGHKSVFSGMDQLRDRIGMLTNASGQKPATAVLKALIIGDKSDISEDTRAAFNRAGLGHLLAISGLHIGIVAAISFFLFRWMLSFSSFLCWRAWVDKSAALLTLLPVLFYGMVSGMSPSTQRAVIMTIVFLAAFQIQRERDHANTLAVAAMAILIFSPPALFSVSFQLSFTAVAAIILGVSILPEGLRIHGESLYLRWRNRVLSFLWISLFAILGTLPLSMYYFNLTSCVGLLANCIAVPLIGFVAVPLGIAAAFLVPFSTTIASFGFHACAAILSCGIAFIDVISGFRFAAVKTFTPSLIEIGVFYFLLWGICAFRKHTKAKWVVVAVLIVMMVDGGYWLHRRLFHNEFRVTVLDVGQGTASVLEFPKGYTMLIDGGGFSDNATFDVGERIVAPFLWRNKIRTVDTLVLSHPNSDHLNGLIYIAENFHVKNLWTNHESVDTLGYQKLMSVVEKNNIRHPDFHSLPRTSTINGVEIKIMHPAVDFDPNGILAKVKGENNNSMVVKTVFGSTSILFSGDICETAEGEILSRHSKEPASTVLICPHHGSKSSSTPGFVSHVDPQYVIITAGWRNRFHFPHPEVLNRYQKQGSRILRTDLNGAVKMITDGKTFRVEPVKIKENANFEHQNL